MLAVVTGVGLYVASTQGPRSATPPASSSTTTSASSSLTPSISPSAAPRPVVVQGPTFTTSGNQILADGAPFVPYGVTVFGLAYPNWQDHVDSDEQQIDVTASTWHGNTVRVQVAPSNLLDQAPYDAAYLTAVESEVAAAQADHLVVILTAQDERTTKIPMPTKSTAAFWRLMAPIYAHDPDVWFDLFNEPRLGASAAGDSAGLWNIWRNGGSGYVGMQHLVKTVRARAPNLVLVEGLDKAETLAGLPTHPIEGASVAYAVHPYFSGPELSSPTAWGENWGNLSGQFPIVADEWGEYESQMASCQQNAPTLVPQFLAYLADHNIGLIAWALKPGVLVVGHDLADPTQFSPGEPFVCAAGDVGSQNGQGVGADVLAYFAAHSRSIP